MLLQYSVDELKPQAIHIYSPLFSIKYTLAEVIEEDVEIHIANRKIILVPRLSSRANSLARDL